MIVIAVEKQVRPVRKMLLNRSTPPPPPLPPPPREQMRTSWIMKGIQRSPEGGGYVLAFDTPQGPKRLHAKVAVCTAPAHRLSDLEGLRVRTTASRGLCVGRRGVAD